MPTPQSEEEARPNPTPSLSAKEHTALAPALPDGERAAEVSAQPASGPIAGQVAALCWRFHKRRAQVLLVTSRETRRWVLPKGWPMSGLSSAAAAAQEAWEEAGVEGKICPNAIGSYSYDKILPNKDPLACSVAVHPLRVEYLKDDFPEQEERRRKWFSAAEAARQVAEPELAELLTRISEAPKQLSGKILDYTTPKPASVKARSVKAKSGLPKAGAPKSKVDPSKNGAGRKGKSASKAPAAEVANEAMTDNLGS